MRTFVIIAVGLIGAGCSSPTRNRGGVGDAGDGASGGTGTFNATGNGTGDGTGNTTIGEPPDATTLADGGGEPSGDDTASGGTTGQSTGGATGESTGGGAGDADVPELKECQQDSDCPGAAPTCAPQGICILCYPGTFECQGSQSMMCSQFGDAWTVAEDCAAVGGTCNPVGGKCQTGCGGSGSLSKTNAGCEFVAVDMHNAFVVNGPNDILDAQNALFAVIASNTTAVEATVTVTHPDGTVDSATVAPGALHKFELPPSFGLTGTGTTASAYKVVSTQPITAYQFNPLANVGVFSNDASVLLPLSGLGKEYYVVTRDQAAADFPGYVVVAATSPGTTQVTVKVSAPTRAGGGVPVIPAGGTYEASLQQWEVLAIESAAVGDDLTGTQVTTDQPAAVFGGSVAAVTSTKCCADHLEQQMAPVATWGKEYVISRSMERGLEKDYIRVTGAFPGTQVTVSPAVTSPATHALGPGQFWEFKTDTHVRVTANQPVMVTQFLASSQEVTHMGDSCFTAADCGQGYDCLFTCIPTFCTSDAECGGGQVCANAQCYPIGDPAMITAVPAEQWQKTYVFLTPDSYTVDYLNVVAPQGATVSLDGQPIPDASFQPIGGTTFRVYRAEVADGSHRIDASEPVGIIVYGYDRDVSYGYPGGLGLKKL